MDKRGKWLTAALILIIVGLMGAFAVQRGLGEHAELKRTEWYRRRADDIKQARTFAAAYRDYNKIIWIGTAANDVEPVVGHRDSSPLILDDADVMISERPVKPGRITLFYDRRSRTGGRLPKKGERWAVHTSCNAKGHWLVHSALPLDKGDGTD